MAGKGDKPRNNFSEEFRDNYDSIDWNQGKTSEKDKNKKECSCKCKKEKK